MYPPQNGAALRQITALGVIAVAMALSGTAGAQRPSANAQASLTCSGATSWQKASNLVGRVATIQGHVAGTRYAASSNGSPTFLNLGVDHPNPSRFTVLIWVENRGAFGRPEVRYRGRSICVRGLVRRYRGVPEIVARSTSQIRIIR
jgi:DNA/RNA endonuclease YhcR with UshA esterase domain